MALTHLKNLAFMSLVLVAMQGCIPFIVAESPEVSSLRVIDSETKKGVTGARLMVKGRPETATSSDLNGNLNAASVRDRKWYPALPFDIIRAPLPLIIEAPGYEPKELLSENRGFMVKPIRNSIVELKKK